MSVGGCSTPFRTIFGGIPGSIALRAAGEKTTGLVDNPVENLGRRWCGLRAGPVDNSTTKLGVEFLLHPNMLWF